MTRVSFPKILLINQCTRDISILRGWVCSSFSFSLFCQTFPASYSRAPERLKLIRTLPNRPEAQFYVLHRLSDTYGGHLCLWCGNGTFQAVTSAVNKIRYEVPENGIFLNLTTEDKHLSLCRTSTRKMWHS